MSWAPRLGAPRTAAPPGSLERGARLLATFLGRTLATAGVVLVLALVVSLALGARPLVVLSGSMEPALAVGDVVVAEPIAPTEARVGDIVTFRSPDGGELVTHRVRAVRLDGDAVRFVTKGDANNAAERWQVGRGDELKRALLRVPMLGQALSLLHRPLGLALGILLPLLLLLALELRAIWRPEASRAPQG